MESSTPELILESLGCGLHTSAKSVMAAVGLYSLRPVLSSPTTSLSVSMMTSDIVVPRGLANPPEDGEAAIAPLSGVLLE